MLTRFSEIRRKARELGVKDPWKYSKFELILLIQGAEGNPQCFGSLRRSCGQDVCLWREECLPPPQS